MEAAKERLLDDEASGIVCDVVNADNVLVVIGREDLLGLRIALVKRVRVGAKNYRYPLLRPVILVAEPHLDRETFRANREVQTPAIIVTFPAPNVLSANSSCRLRACVTTSALCSVENLNVSLFFPLRKVTLNSLVVPCTGETETTSDHGHWFVASLEDGFRVATEAVPRASTRLYFPFHEC